MQINCTKRGLAGKSYDESICVFFSQLVSSAVEGYNNANYVQVHSDGLTSAVRILVGGSKLLACLNQPLNLATFSTILLVNCRLKIRFSERIPSECDRSTLIDINCIAIATACD